MLKVAICDDDMNVINNMKEIIKGELNDCFIDTYNSGETLIEKKKYYDIIFLDIDMEGVNGIEAGKRIRSYDKKVYIIYVTNFSDYRKYAFSLHAFGYLEKPIKREEVLNEIQEVISYKNEVETTQDMLEFSTEEGIVRIEAREIYYFEYSDRRIYMETQKGRYTLRKRINDIANDMEQYGFIMPHKSFCVNLFHVKNVKGYDILITNGKMVPLSQKKSPYFREQLNIFLEHLIG